MRLTIPLQALGIDARGEAFEAPARTVDVSRYGAQVQLSRSLQSGQTVQLINPAGRGEAEFRVVRPIPSARNGDDYGLECLDEQENIWQIQFPSPADGETADAKALVECRMCGTVALANLTLGQLDILRTVRVVAKNCPNCRTVTPMRYAELRVARQSEAGWFSAVTRLARPRRHRRVCLQVPLGIRNGSNSVEITRTENVSREGFCVKSEKDYDLGQVVMVVFPGDAEGRETEVPAQVVWQQTIGRTRRKLYGLKCARLEA